MGGKSSKAPPPPDYAGAARATAEADKEALAQQTWANRPEQIDPWGNISYEQEKVLDPGTGKYVTKWTQRTNLDPNLKAALDSQLNLQRDRSQLGEQLMGRAQNEYGEAMDWSQLTDWGQVPLSGDEARQQAEDALYGRATSRLDPQWEQRSSDLEAKLVAQGLRPGDAAWDRQMANEERARQDDYARARQEAIIGGGQEQARQFDMGMGASQYQSELRQNQLAEQMQKRGFSLNEINALLSGQQVNTPEFQSFSQAGRGEGTDYLGATDMGYQAALGKASADNAARQGMFGGLGTLAGVGMKMYGF